MRVDDENRRDKKDGANDEADAVPRLLDDGRRLRTRAPREVRRRRIPDRGGHSRGGCAPTAAAVFALLAH